MAFLKSIIFILLLFVPFNGSAQSKLTSRNKSAIKDYNEAVRLYGARKTKESKVALLSATKKDPKFIEAYLLLGDLYHQKKDYSSELDVLKKAVSIDSTYFPPAILNIGVAYYLNENFDEAVQWLKLYQSTSSKNSLKAEEWLERAQFAQLSVKNAPNIHLHLVGDSLDNQHDEYWPSLTADEQTMVVTVLVPRGSFQNSYELPKSSVYFQEDFYYYTQDVSGWGRRKKLEGNINSDGNEGAQTLSADGNWMFFTACGREDGRGSCDIYFSKRTTSGWSDPVNLGMPINTPYWESQPAFSSDGKTLLFVSNRPGGVGGKDIWQATIQGFKTDGTPIFGNLHCLNKNINTTKDENSPFLHHDNKTLYFSSNGRPGMGEMDIFFSRRNEDGVWQPAQNMGYPINTPGDEIGFVVNAKGDKAYLSSNRKKEHSTNKSIYWFELPEPLQPKPVIYVKGNVYDNETKERLAADFILQDLSSTADVVVTKSNPSTGEFLVCLPLGGRYSFKASRPGYLFYSGHFNIADNHSLEKPYLLDVALQPIKQGAKVILKNIFFEVDSYQLREESKVELNNLIEFLKSNANLKIQIGGHTDNQGKATYNQTLSEKRANEVKKYLINGGISGNLLEAKGFGMSQPIEENSTEEGRATNRRTEITIL